MKLVTRASWGARKPEHRTTATLNDESTCHWNGPTITVGGKTTWDHSRCAGLVRGIQNFHMDSRGWSDIAYNFVECPHGYTFEGRGLNVINGANGTNTGNRTSHAICCLGGEGNSFSEKEKVGFKGCVKYIADHTLAPDKAQGHRDHKSTACPGDARYKWVHAGMPVASTPPPPPPSMKEDSLMIKIIWLKKTGGPDAAYEIVYAASAIDRNRQIMVSATHIPNETILNVRRYSLGGIENQKRINPGELNKAGVPIYGGPYKNR